MPHTKTLALTAVVTLIVAYIMGSVALAAVCCILVCFLIGKKILCSVNQRAVVNAEEIIPEQLAKAMRDYKEIETARSRLKNKRLADQDMRLQEKAGQILTYPKDHPQNLYAANRFINYYQDRTAALVGHCVSLEAVGISTPESTKIIQRTVTILAGFEEAYEKQFAKIIDMELLGMDAELKVAHQELAGDGIDCNKSVLRRKSFPTKITKSQPDDSPTAHKGRTWQPKAIGAVLLTVLGGYGIYQFFSQDKD